jgi:hypothetical protein
LILKKMEDEWIMPWFYKKYIANTAPLPPLIEPITVKIKKRRLSYPREDYNESCWSRMLLNPNIQVEDHRDGKLFRKRFRIPYTAFIKLVELFETVEYSFCTSHHNASGRISVPLKLKILGVLRVLGRASTFECILQN